MNRFGTKTLQSERCYLRKLKLSDATQLFENVFSDSKVSQYMSWERYTDIEDVKDYLTKWQDYYHQKECYWGVFLKENNVLIGTIYLYTENSNAKLGFISYCLGSKYWGKGYATETVSVVLRYGFKELGYNNITTFCAKSNYRSQNVLKRLGFKFEAILRMRDKTDYGYEDCLYYSLLKNEMEEDHYISLDNVISMV